jgi:hypothetical protein
VVHTLTAVGFVTPGDHPGHDNDTSTDNTTFASDVPVVPIGDTRITRYHGKGQSWEIEGTVGRSGAAPDAAGSRVSADRVKKVQIAVVYTAGGAHAATASPCRWVGGPSARLVAEPVTKAACGKPVWLRARLAPSGRTWSYTLNHPLPRGCFTVYARSFDSLGLTQVDFSAKLGNRRVFCAS